jgi:DNA polymerase-3 subunit alpha
MPDFDVDFCQDRRGEVIEYVGRKYGAENVSQIITFGKLQAKAVMKDVGRVLGFTFAESDQLTKLVPEELHITISKAIEQEPRLREKIEQEPRTAKAIEYALALEGLYRNAGVHAAGVIITEEPIVSYSPLYAGKDGVVVTQFDKDSAETIGLVKFDFLGLKTLTVIDHAVKLIRKTAEPGTPETEFSIELINYKDLAVFELISSGDTDGVFQIESSGMKDLCSRLQPNSIEDLTAICALYRPGPLGSGMVDDFIDRKHGRKPINYDVPQLENILRDTYGVIVYQEQVMQMARDLAGYSLGQADLLRRAMGKKKAEEMAKHRAIFSKGAVERGIDEAKATALFDLMEKFAEYGFNKSHSAAYAVVSYQTAYLKTHFPAEFMAALMTTEMDNTDKITRYIGDARAHGIPVLSPDVNHSQKRFSVERGANNVKCIRFGLEAIKGVGSIAVDSILQARTESPFKNAMDFCRRVSTRKANKKVIESLTLAGAFDPIAEVNRASLFASIETLVEFAGDEQEERELGQHSLFDAFASEEVNLVTHSADSVFKREEEWPEARKLAMEKQIVGFYVSGHPMDKWQNICEDWLGWSTERVRTAEPPKEARSAPSGANGSQGQGGGWRRPQRPEIKIAGLIGEIKEIVNKKGQRMAFAQLEDLKGKVELTFFSDAFTASQEMLKQSATEAEPVVVTGELEVRDDGGKILVRSLEWVSEAHRTRVQQVIVKLRPSAVSPDQLRELKKYFLQNRGKCPVRIDFVDSDFRTSLRLPKTVRISANPQLVQAVNRIFGADVVQLQ